MNVEQNVSVQRYLRIFFGAYVVLHIIIGMLNEVFDYDAIGALVVVKTMSAGGFAAASFIKRERREPTRKEKNKLILGCLFLFTFLEAVVLALSYFWGNLEGIIFVGESFGFKGLFPTIIAAFSLFSVINFFFLRWVFGSEARKMSERYEEKQAEKTSD